MQSIDFFWAYKKLKINLSIKMDKNDIVFDLLKLKSFKMEYKLPELRAQEYTTDSTFISNINSKYTKEVIDFEKKVKKL